MYSIVYMSYKYVYNYIFYLYVNIYSRIVSIFMSSDNRDGTTIRFYFHLNNQTSLVLMKHEVLVFKVFGSDLHEVIGYRLLL